MLENGVFHPLEDVKIEEGTLVDGDIGDGVDYLNKLRDKSRG